LVAITIEGAALSETNSRPIGGNEIIDVAEYFGSMVLEDADKVHYYQLKHSTVNATESWKVP
jgi:hypothetical protein